MLLRKCVAEKLPSSTCTEDMSLFLSLLLSPFLLFSCPVDCLSTLVVNALGARVTDSVSSIHRVIEAFDDTDGKNKNKTLPDLSGLVERILYTREDAYKALPKATRRFPLEFSPFEQFEFP